MIGEAPFDIGRVSVGTPLGDEDSVLGGEICSLRAPGFVGAEAAMQEENRLTLALDLVSRLDAGKFDVLAHPISYLSVREGAEHRATTPPLRLVT